MISAPVKVAFADFSLQHQPIQAQLERAIRAVIQRGDFVLGEALKEFEAAFAAACASEYGIGVGCGTDAIALALSAAGICPGDEVILPANTFIATLIGVLRAGATPVLVDCEEETALIDLSQAERAISPKTRAIVPVHLYGQVVSPRQLRNLADRYKLLILEDAAQAHLAEREGAIAGSFGTAAAFSFYPSKNLGGFGDGGMVVTRDAEIARKVRSLRNYGAPQKYLHSDLGTNSRLDTIQAAVLNVKLPYLTEWNRQRLQAAKTYDTLFAPLRSRGIIPIQNHSGSGHVYHLYVIRITDECPVNRQTLQEKLSQEGIQTGIHYPLPCHLQPAYQHLGCKKGDFPRAETLSQQVLSLPMYPGLSDAQVDRVVSAIAAIVS